LTLASPLSEKTVLEVSDISGWEGDREECGELGVPRMSNRVSRGMFELEYGRGGGGGGVGGGGGGGWGSFLHGRVVDIPLHRSFKSLGQGAPLWNGMDVDPDMNLDSIVVNH
jgi:hypothetical protein